MRARRNFPSPLAGESAERGTREAGEGTFGLRADKSEFGSTPHPAPRLRSSPPSPARGEGKADFAATALLKNARRLRSTMTDAERKLWFALRDRRFADFKFRRQAVIGPFIVDFVCLQHRLIIEVDGGQHAESRIDLSRDRWLALKNFRVLRFWNNDVLSNLEGTLSAIFRELTGALP